MIMTTHEEMQGQTFQSVLSPSKDGVSEQSRPIEGASAGKEPHVPSDFLNAPSFANAGATCGGESSNLIHAPPIPTSLPLNNTNFLYGESYSAKSSAAKKEAKPSSSNPFTTPPSGRKLGSYRNMKLKSG